VAILDSNKSVDNDKIKTFAILMGVIERVLVSYL
ncbi:uncharacterized protein METZ01_LOCUS246375, partial [marine metagenome]